ncbi:MAG: hypothetical protein FWG43_01510 [Clostridiales bacterium]|nr:hypothetical protein [Clostridiales bacterium]
MKKVLAIAIVMVLALTFMVPVMAAETGAKERVEVKGAGFHCNVGNGNGKENIAAYKDGWLEFEFISGTTWKLLSDKYVCPKCGKNEWVSFSNNSGVPNGKNIQLQHPGAAELKYAGIAIDQEVMVTTINTKTIEKWQGEKTPYQTITQYVSEKFDSTTLSNAGAPKVVTNSNHFCYAVLSKADLAKGSVQLELFNGNKLNVVGKASASLVNGQIVVKFGNNLMPASKYGIVAFDGFMPVVKNGNIHSVNIFKTGAGNAITPYTEKSFQSSDKKGANYDKDWADILKNAVKDTKNIYLYMHANPIQFDLGIEESAIAWKVTKAPELVWTKTIDIPLEPEQAFIDVKIFDAANVEIEEAKLIATDFKPGAYTVVFYDTFLGQEVVKVVEVAKDTVVAVEYKAAYNIDGEKLPTERIDLPFVEKDLVITYKTITVK